MKSAVLFVTAFLLSFSLIAADLPVPGELIGSDTIGIVHVDLSAVKLGTVQKTVADKAGSSPDSGSFEKVQTLLDAFKAAGGTGLTVLLNVGKDADKADPTDSIVLVVNKKEESDNAKLTELFNALAEPLKDKLDKKCPKEIEGSLVWHSAKFKLPKADEDREESFTTAYGHLTKGTTLSLVIVPDEDAATLAESKIKETNPEEAKLVKALMGGDGFCIFTDFGAADEPSLKLLALASDADEAKTLETAMKGLLAEAKKGAPPEAEALFKSLNVVQVGANVQLALDFAALAKAITSMIPKP